MSGMGRAAQKVLARGGVVAYPTEAVYGLGCDPANATAVERLLQLKHRSWRKGLILIAAEFDALRPWTAPLTPEMEARVTATWPGPVTWLLPAAADCPPCLRGEHETLAVRVTAHPIAAALCRAWGGALVSTSANPAGEPPARAADEVRRRFPEGIDLVIEGAVGGLTGPTPIRDARSDTTVREPHPQ